MLLRIIGVVSKCLINRLSVYRTYVDVWPIHRVLTNRRLNESKQRWWVFADKKWTKLTQYEFHFVWESKSYSWLWLCLHVYMRHACLCPCVFLYATFWQSFCVVQRYRYSGVHVELNSPLWRMQFQVGPVSLWTGRDVTLIPDRPSASYFSLQFNASSQQHDASQWC